MTIALVFAAAMIQTPVTPPDSNAVVAIYADQGNGVALQGTGFFIDSRGGIVTAYHIVNGAKSLVIYHKGSNYRDVSVEAVGPRHDLARLRLAQPPANHHSLRLASTGPEAVADERLRLIGWPRNQDNSTLRGYLTTGRLTSSKYLSNHLLQRVFRHDIPILTVDITTEPGISGAPLVSSQGVIGMLSGSYNTGGGIAWVIPVSHMSRLESIYPSRSPSEMTWPNFDLMYPERSTGLRAAYSYNQDAALIFVNAEARIETVRSAINELSDSIRSVLHVARLIVETDSALLGDRPDNGDRSALISRRQMLFEQLSVGRTVVDDILYGETATLEEFSELFYSLQEHVENAIETLVLTDEDDSTARLRAGLADIAAAEERAERLGDQLTNQDERTRALERELGVAKEANQDESWMPEVLILEIAWLDAMREFYHSVMEGGILAEAEIMLKGFTQLHELYTFNRRLREVEEQGQ